MYRTVILANKYGLEIFLAVYLSSDVQRSGKKCMPGAKVYMFTAEADNTLRDLHKSSYDTKAEFNNCFIIHSK